MSEERFKLNVPGIGKVNAAVEMPLVEETEAAVVIAHGQVNDLDYELLTAFSIGLAERGYASIRFNFPYREKGGKTPDDNEVLIKTFEAGRKEIESRTDDAKVVLAGKSLGARIASLCALREAASGLIFLGYPIHGPNGETREFDHLLKIDAPMLFFAGTNDPFCKIEKLQAILEQREAVSSIQLVERGDHSFIVPKGDARPMELIYEDIASIAADWIDEYI